MAGSAVSASPIRTITHHPPSLPPSKSPSVRRSRSSRDHGSEQLHCNGKGGGGGGGRQRRGRAVAAPETADIARGDAAGRQPEFGGRRREGDGNGTVAALAQTAANQIKPTFSLHLSNQPARLGSELLERLALPLLCEAVALAVRSIAHPRPTQHVPGRNSG